MQSTDRLRRAIGQRLTATEGGLADLRVEILHLVLAFEAERRSRRGVVPKIESSLPQS